MLAEQTRTPLVSSLAACTLVTCTLVRQPESRAHDAHGGAAPSPDAVLPHCKPRSDPSRFTPPLWQTGRSRGSADPQRTRAAVAVCSCSQDFSFTAGQVADLDSLHHSFPMKVQHCMSSHADPHLTLHSSACQTLNPESGRLPDGTRAWRSADDGAAGGGPSGAAAGLGEQPAVHQGGLGGVAALLRRGAAAGVPLARPARHPASRPGAPRRRTGRSGRGLQCRYGGQAVAPKTAAPTVLLSCHHTAAQLGLMRAWLAPPKSLPSSDLYVPPLYCYSLTLHVPLCRCSLMLDALMWIIRRLHTMACRSGSTCLSNWNFAHCQYHDPVF